MTCRFCFREVSSLLGNGQYQLWLRKRHNSFHFEFVLRGLSCNHANAVPSLLLQFFSLVILFSKEYMSSCNFPFVFYTPQESPDFPAFFIPCNPGPSMNILNVGDKLPVQRGFLTNSAGDLLPALGFLGGLYNFL